MMNFVTKIFIVLSFICLFELSQARRGAKHRKNPEKLNTSELDVRNSANGSVAFETGNVNTTNQPSTTTRRTVRKMSHRRNLEKRCCKVGYRAAKRNLFCLADRFYTEKYRNMEHYARQKFQYQGKPKRGIRRLMNHFENFCNKHELKSVFYKCCLDGIFMAREKSRR